MYTIVHDVHTCSSVLQPPALAEGDAEGFADGFRRWGRRFGQDDKLRKFT